MKKKDLQNEILKYQADIDAQFKKSQDLEKEVDGIQSKQKEFENSIENLKRERQLNQVSRDKLLKSLRAKDEEIRAKEKEIEALNSQLKEGSNAQQMLQNQIRDTTQAKLKFESQSKRLNEELVQQKTKITRNFTKITRCR